MLSCDICRVIFSYSKMSISTCMREQASSSWRSKMFSLLIQEFTRAQWWTALGRHLCLQSSPFKVQQFAGERKVNQRHSVQMSLVVFPIFARNIHFFPLSSLSVSLSLCSLNDAVIAWSMLQLETLCWFIGNKRLSKCFVTDSFKNTFSLLLWLWLLCFEHWLAFQQMKPGTYYNQ